ncbi:MAG: hypothetical protein KAS32_23920 [Candidatus Peribacteraceae bacterium]|nr:hypothetical protein [Candidatus Peribacteraceae bacterium]
MDEMEKRQRLDRCPECGGIADNGHDREFPPNPYLCKKGEQVIKDG